MARFKVQYVDQGNAAEFDAGLANRPKLVLIETPSNPLLRVVDIAVIARKARAFGAAVAVDSTFLSPALQRPYRLAPISSSIQPPNISTDTRTWWAEPLSRRNPRMRRNLRCGPISQE